MNRQHFIKSMTALGALASTPQLLPAQSETTTKEGDGYTFLFQGDSITDGNRSRNTDWNHVMGHGYAYLIACRLGYEHPQKDFHFFNRGISGNKIPDLAARWQNDTLDIKPNLLSIMIGINDVAAAIGGNTAFTATAFEEGYRALLQQTMAALPGVQLVLCTPFILPVGKVKDNRDRFLAETTARQQAVATLSKEFNAIYVNLQPVFDKAVSKAPASYWIWDGIHPMPAGHELIAREWIRQVGKRLAFVR
jgi:lysophospholipase L1-like esterase